EDPARGVALVDGHLDALLLLDAEGRGPAGRRTGDPDDHGLAGQLSGGRRRGKRGGHRDEDRQDACCGHVPSLSTVSACRIVTPSISLLTVTLTQGVIKVKCRQ